MSRQRNNYLQLFIFLLVASLTLVIGDNQGWWSSVREVVETKIVARRVDHSESQPEKMAQLESKVISLEHTNTMLAQENEALRKQLASPLPPKLQFIPGYVISLAITGDKAILKVAGGELDGIQKNMPVVSEAILIGFVEQVSPRMSDIRLLSSNQSKVAVTTSRGAQGLIVGIEEKSRPDNAIIDRVLQTEALEVGDAVVTSGEDGLPPNLIIGTVTEILSESRDPFQQARVSLSVKPELLKRVFIIENAL